MSTGINIQSASYGVGSTTVDVSQAVAAKNVDGAINFVVTPAALNVHDPAVGRVKTLTVNYTINNGGSNTATAKDGDTLSILAPPARLATGLEIKKAQYGYDGNWADVTSAVQTYVSNGSINMTVSPATVGIPDPNPNKPKTLKVDLTINGKPSSRSIADGKKFTLSAPAVTDSSSADSKPVNVVWSVVSIIFTKALLCVLMTVWLTSVRVGSEYGATLFSGGGYVIGALGLFTFGLYPIFGLPIALFWWGLIVG